jgi:tetratricopeptide (TPR) repeat protein
MNQDKLTRMRQVLVERFSLEQLYTLCADLGWDYENLPGHQIKVSLARELVAELKRQRRIPELEQQILETRPDISRANFVSQTPDPIPDPDTLPPPGRLPSGSRLPFTRNALFTGREVALKALARALFHDDASSTLITQAVQGIGGIGKTQLAVEFAHRYGRFFQGVHWVSAAQMDAIGSEVAACGRAMLLPRWPEEEPEQIRQTLAAWRTGGPRLVILDNLEDVSAAREWLQRLSGGPVRVLVTTRRRRWPRDLGMRPMRLLFFSAEESVRFLRQYLPEDRATDAELQALAERLYHLPLALELAGRYLETVVRTTVSDYLAELETVWAHRSLDKWQEEGSATDHDLSMARTFAVSWARVEGEAARRLFLAAGWCAPNVPIPWALLEAAAEVEGNACDEAVATLAGLGLLELEERETGPTIHPLLAEYIRHVDGAEEVLDAVIQSVGSQAEAANKTGLPAPFERLRLHVQWVARQAETAGLDDAGWLWNELGYHLNMIADYAGARKAYERALKIDKVAFGPEDPNVAFRLNNLGMVLMAQGDLEEARAAFERALLIHEAVFGPEHLDVARDVNNLGLVLLAQGDLAGARAAFERVLGILEKEPTSECPWVAATTSNLGLVLQDQGDLIAARALHERALAMNEAIFGPNHPEVATDVSNLGLVLRAQGDLAGARMVFARALAIDEATYGPDHPNIARDLNNLGLVLQDLAELREAQAAYERALAIYEKILPPGHQYIGVTRSNLASVKRELGEYTEG